jgi:hypothetical protein
MLGVDLSSDLMTAFLHELSRTESDHPRRQKSFLKYPCARVDMCVESLFIPNVLVVKSVIHALSSREPHGHEWGNTAP